MTQQAKATRPINDEKQSRRQLLTNASTLSACLLLGSAFSTPAAAQSDPRYGIQGKAAPDFALDYWIDKEGNPTSYSMAAQKGKWVYFYCFQDWCPGCHSHGFPSLNKLAAEFSDHPDVSIAAAQTVFEGFQSNTLKDVRKLQVKYELPITMGHDPGDPNGNYRPKIMQKYRTGGTPWTIVVHPGGNVVFNDFHIDIEKFIEYLHQQIG